MQAAEFKKPQTTPRNSSMVIISIIMNKIHFLLPILRNLFFELKHVLVNMLSNKSIC